MDGDTKQLLTECYIILLSFKVFVLTKTNEEQLDSLLEKIRLKIGYPD